VAALTSEKLWEEEWRVEIERRLVEVRDGVAKLEDPARVLKELRADLASRKRGRAGPARSSSTKARRRAT